MRKLIAAAAVVAGVVGVGSQAGAAPKSLSGPWQCYGGGYDGEFVEINIAGRNGWIDGVPYRAVQVSVTGIDENGEPFYDIQLWGNGRELLRPDAISCIQDLNPFDYDSIAVLAVPK